MALRKVSKGESQNQLSEKAVEPPLKELVGQPPARSDGGIAHPPWAGRGTISPITLGRPIRTVNNHRFPACPLLGDIPTRCSLPGVRALPRYEQLAGGRSQKGNPAGGTNIATWELFLFSMLHFKQALAGKTLCMLLMCLLLFPYLHLFNCLNQVLGVLPFLS